MITDPRPWITVRDAADMLDVTPEKVRRLIYNGELKAGQRGRRGNHWRLRPEVVEAYIREHP